MRILLDHCVPRRLGRLILGHEVTPAQKMGWEELKNGTLLSVAEAEGFSVLLTVDKNLRYQQNLVGRQIAVVTLNSRFVDVVSLAPLLPELMAVLTSIQPGAFVVVGPDEGPKG